MTWQIILAITVPTASVIVAAIEARARGKQNIADLRGDHDSLAAKVDEIKTKVDENGTQIGQLVAGQSKLQGTLDTLLAFTRPVATERAVGTPAEEPVGS